ncbi:oxidoreductase [Colletotrichum kahawae]|uniref:Oxidoreductase n=1 Tax=Colletotrichum kahawae TaxID=34407 RepID=A0AAD9YD74_COLKA|nr:oxidoreductase [Colletotrichum kahawae]
MATLKKIAVIGGTGDLGHVVVQQLVAAGIFDVAVVTRDSRDTRGKIPTGAKTAEADYESPESLTTAFRGFDAVVCTLPGHLEALLLRILDAAIAAGVRRFVPSEFGSDHRQPAAHSVPLSASKIKVDNTLRQAAAEGRIDIPERKFFIHDGGDIPFGLTTRKSFGDAVAGALRHPGETKNQIYTIEVISLTQNRVLQLVKEALPDLELEIVHVNTKERYERGVKKLVSGVFDMSVVGDMVLRFVFDSELQLTSDTQAANELLGVERITEKQFKELVRSLAN